MKKYFIVTIFSLSIFVYSGNVFAQTTSASATPAGDIDIEAQVVDLVGGPTGFMETFRKKQTIYFSTLRDKTKQKLGIITTSSLGEAPSAPVPFTPGENANDLPQYKQDNPLDYATLIFATSMASVFSEVLLFYIALIILIFILIRFFFKLFI